jgi:hypothetical protein
MTEAIFVACIVTDVGTDVPSQKTTCYQCGAELWISDLVLELATKDHPGADVNAYCVYTCMPQGDGPLTVPEVQRAYLRDEHGLTDDEIDALLDLSELIRRRE